MSIQYLKTKTNASFIRPTGYIFPVGLSVANNSLPVTSNTSVDYLVVAGGGAGSGAGGAVSGGGGAGGMLTGSLRIKAEDTYTVTVGSGGTGTTGVGTNGANSSFGSIALSIGGGFGGSNYTIVGNGGSGGGGFFNGGNAGTGIPGQGNNGGTAASLTFGGGGGGAGGAGGQYGGGAGLSSSLSGSAVTYAVGALSGYDPGAPTPVPGAAGTVNRGNGGGGAFGTATPASGGPGGSGIVIIRYLGANAATGGTVTNTGGYAIHTFTGDGTFQFNRYFVN